MEALVCRASNDPHVAAVIILDVCRVITRGVGPFSAEPWVLYELLTNHIQIHLSPGLAKVHIGDAATATTSIFNS